MDVDISADGFKNLGSLLKPYAPKSTRLTYLIRIPKKIIELYGKPDMHPGVKKLLSSVLRTTHNATTMVLERLKTSGFDNTNSACGGCLVLWRDEFASLHEDLKSSGSEYRPEEAVPILERINISVWNFLIGSNPLIGRRVKLPRVPVPPDAASDHGQDPPSSSNQGAASFVVLTQAKFDAQSCCHPGTRQKILTSIPTKLSKYPCVFLRGTPGSGKSFIARTVCKNLRDNEFLPLAAYFFFQKSHPYSHDSDMAMVIFVVTLAYQLAAFSHEFRDAFIKHLTANYDTVDARDEVIEESLDNQLYGILSESLLSVNKPHTPWVIVLNAVERFCSSEPGGQGIGIARLLQFLSRFIPSGVHPDESLSQPLHFIRFLITSQPDRLVYRACMQANSAFGGLTREPPEDALIDLVYEAPDSTESDIQSVVAARLDRAAKWVEITSSSESDPWRPDADKITTFVSQCSHQFWYAEVRLRTFEDEIKDGGSPEAVFDSILMDEDGPDAELPEGVLVEQRADFELVNILDTLEGLSPEKLWKSMEWIADDKPMRRQAMMFRDSDAERLAELAHKCLTLPLESNRVKILRLLQDICSCSDQLPTSYWLKNADVKYNRNSDTFGHGGEAFIVRGTWNGKDARDNQRVKLVSDKPIVVAVRVAHEDINPEPADWVEINKRVRREIVTHAQLKNPYILELYGILAVENGFPEMVVPYMDGSPADKYLKTHKRACDTRKIIYGVSSALYYLHTLKPPVLHGDLHPGNVLVNSKGEGVLCDFGYSRIRHTVSRSRSLRRSGGVRSYTAPELSNTNRFVATSQATDIYGLGILYFALSTRSKPPDEDKPNWKGEGISTGLPPDAVEKLSALTQKMWSDTPKERGDATQAHEGILEICEIIDDADDSSDSSDED